jgi:L-alanine-DL-glutamate epimerase and related enzymes of enolase superfamily
MSIIKKVTCHVVSAPIERPFTSSRGWLYKTRGSCIVEIETQDGVVGWGECYGPAQAARAFIESQFAPRVDELMHTAPYSLDEDGCVSPPAGVGIGMQINHDFLNTHPLIEGPCYV